MGLLGDVGRGVEAGDRVLGQQEAERQHVEPEDEAADRAVAEAGVVDPLAEDEAEALVVSGTKTRIAMITATPNTCHQTEMLLTPPAGGCGRC